MSKIAIRVDYTSTDSNGNPKYEWVVLPTYQVADDYDLGGLGASDIIGQVGGAHRTFGGGTKPSGQ